MTKPVPEFPASPAQLHSIPHEHGMEASDLVIGKIYMLKSGHIMRYHGKWNRGPCLSFRIPSVPIPNVVNSGPSFGADEVLREISEKDIPALKNRVLAGRARNLHEYAAEMEFVIKELSGE